MYHADERPGRGGDHRKARYHGCFANFYEALYATRRIDEVIKTDMTSRECVPVQPITADEVRACLSKMAKCKAGDEQGNVVEMLQKGGDHLMQVLVELFDDILDPASIPPEQWRMAKLIVLFKKGDAADPSNYRPIAILPILYKVFSKIICNRLRIMFDNAQTADQAGFRSGYSCDDHLLTSVVIVEKAYEFNMSLWAATVDFQKAFDTVEHDSIWKAMRDVGIPDESSHGCTGNSLI